MARRTNAKTPEAVAPPTAQTQEQITLEVLVSAITALVRINSGKWSMPRNLLPRLPCTLNYTINEAEVVFTEGTKS